jgi:hypothetical protein
MHLRFDLQKYKFAALLYPRIQQKCWNPWVARRFLVFFWSVPRKNGEPNDFPFGDLDCKAAHTDGYRGRL